MFISILTWNIDNSQCVSTTHIVLFQLVLSGVPQRAVLCPILFNLYIYDLFLYTKKATLHNYADDNTLTAFSNSVPNLFRILEQESNVAIDWLERNQMIANPTNSMPY